MENKPRKPWVAGLMALLTIGLGHIYAGQAKKGIILYLTQGIILAILLLLLVVKLNIFTIALIFIVGMAYFIYTVINAVVIARKNSTNYELKNYNRWYIYLFLLVFANVIVQPIFETIIKENSIKAYKLPSGAMVPTLLIGDHILVNRFIYKNTQPQKGDVAVFEFPEDKNKDFIKRIVGTEGDEVEVKDKKLYINNVEQIETYIIHKDSNIFPASKQPRDNFGPIKVPAGSLFFMGDNRDNSYDSRFWGVVAKEKVRGKAMSIYWSWDKETGQVRWDRIGNRIQ